MLTQFNTKHNEDRYTEVFVFKLGAPIACTAYVTSNLCDFNRFDIMGNFQELNQREQEGQLDEGFLSEVNAQLRNAKEDGDKPGLEAMLQKVLQLYASRVLSKRSYARKGDEILKAEQFLETIIKGFYSAVCCTYEYMMI
nr:uncharacterized protein LOC109161862 isoform X3 [Ipomoea batatas]